MQNLVKGILFNNGYLKLDLNKMINPGCAKLELYKENEVITNFKEYYVANNVLFIEVDVPCDSNYIYIHIDDIRLRYSFCF